MQQRKQNKSNTLKDDYIIPARKPSGFFFQLVQCYSEVIFLYHPNGRVNVEKDNLIDF